MILHVVVLEPGLVVFKTYNGYWFCDRDRFYPYRKTYGQEFQEQE